MATITTKGSVNPMIAGLSKLFRSKDMALAFGLVMIVGLMIVPLPPALVDVLVILNLGFSIAIILLTMFISKPMDFSSFPTVLLFVTLIRLGINMAASRLILLNGDAGSVIAAFGSVLVGGNYVVGVVIFLMLMIIQFTVINSGAGRVAEVAARFTLDAMPGKQLAIDADLNSGMIDENTARTRRKAIEAEADFYGSMDGATKFVRGDAIAAIIIMIVNILGGILIGVLQRGEDVMTALQSYALLTVGAGIAVQVPALLVSAASGITVTRSSSDETLATEVFGQISNFNTLSVGALIVSMMIFIPGLPKLPVILVAGLLGGAAFFAMQNQQKVADAIIPTEEVPVGRREPESPEDMLEMVVVDPIELEIGYGLIPIVDENSQDNLLRRITGIRRQIMMELGIILPIVRIRDNLRLQPQEYRVRVRGQEVARGQLLLDRLLAIPGSETDASLNGVHTTEPAFGLPAVWIGENDRGRAELMGYTVVTPTSVLSTHITEVVRSHAPELLSRQMVQEILDQLRSKAPAAVEGVVPEMLSIGDLQAVLRILLRERVPIRDVPGILETLANSAPITRDPNVLSEAVRQTLAATLSSMFRDDKNTVHVMTLSPHLEAILKNSLSNNDGGIGFHIDAPTAQSILNQVGQRMEAMAAEGFMPVLLTPRELRLAFRRLIEHAFPTLVVLAFSEISQGTRVKSHGLVDIG